MILPILLAALAQQPAADSSRPRRLDPVVVTADRAAGSLAASVASITRLSGAELRAWPRATLADLLQKAPGIAVVNFDGLGFDPQVIMRGFYGGGEAEYVLLLVDGKPLAQVATGVVAWDVLPPPEQIAAIEVVRGSGSSLYGDAALGGVVNVITQATVPDSSKASMRVAGGVGSHNTRRSTLSTGGPESVLALTAALNRTDGYRAHSKRTAGQGTVTIPMGRGPAAPLTLSLRSHWRRYDEPGPLLDSILATGATKSDPLFGFDRTTDWAVGGGLDGRTTLGPRASLTGSAGFEFRKLDGVRTLALAPGFGDTKARRARTTRISLSGQALIPEAALPGRGRVVAGVEASRSGLDSRYYQVAGGSRSDYGQADGSRGDLDSDTFASRAAVAGYTEYSVVPTGALRLSIGGRFDLLHDALAPEPPGDVTHRSTTHTALSPRVGANLRLGAGAGHVFLVMSRTFKAPTLDQLYDRRNIPIPFPPFSVTTSNPELTPQRGTGIEAGFYRGGRVGRTMTAAGSLSVYHFRMTDELDFDVESFRYVNIGRSRHRGIEADLRLESENVSMYAGYGLQDAVARAGSNAGKRLKAIPRHTVTGGVTVRSLVPPNRPEFSLTAIHQGGMVLDDANNRPLPAYTRFDGRVSIRLRGALFHLDGRNLFNARYSSTGFLDPAGTGAAYYYPAAGRVFEFGARFGL